MFYVNTSRGAVNVLRHHKPRSCQCYTSSQAEELTMFFVKTEHPQNYRVTLLRM